MHIPIARIGSIALMVLMVGRSGGAASWIPPGELAKQSDLVVVGQVMQITSYRAEERGVKIQDPHAAFECVTCLNTEILLRVDETMKGSEPAEGTVTINLAGGRIGYIDTINSNDPIPGVGARVGVFLKRYSKASSFYIYTLPEASVYHLKDDVLIPYGGLDVIEVPGRDALQAGKRRTYDVDKFRTLVTPGAGVDRKSNSTTQP